MQFAVGAQVIIASTGAPANYMSGQVTAYSGTSLTVNVATTGGSGTFAVWTISVSGVQGPAGSATGTASGDLSGSYPSPTVAKVNGIPAASLGLPVSYATGVNATVPVVSYSASTSNLGVNLDFSAVPSGSGAFQLTIPDGTVVGGNKRGANAVDLQGPSQRTTASQVASGASAFAAGWGCQASGPNSVSLGYGATATNMYAIALGRSVTASGYAALALGYASAASGKMSVTFGYLTTTNNITGQVAFGFNGSSGGQFQRTFTELYAITTSTTAKVATADGASAATTNQLTLRANSAYRVTIQAVARDATNNADAKEWTTVVLITRGATSASTAIVGSPTITTTFATAGASGWTLAVSADTTNGALAVTVTSSTADTVDWNIQLDAIEVM